jgi:hypothetical protein
MNYISHSKPSKAEKWLFQAMAKEEIAARVQKPIV